MPSEIRPARATDRYRYADTIASATHRKKKKLLLDAEPAVPPLYQRQHDERIRRERERIAAEMDQRGAGLAGHERLARGLVMGDALKACHGCCHETVETDRVMRRAGWRHRHGRWFCPSCVKARLKKH